MAKFLGVNKRRPKLTRSQSFKFKGTWVIIENRQKLSFGCSVPEPPKRPAPFSFDFFEFTIQTHRL